MLVVVAELGERRIGGRRLRHADLIEDEVEVQPAALAIVGGADHRRLVDVVGGFLFRRRQCRGSDGRTVAHQRVGDARPRRMQSTPPASRNSVSMDMSRNVSLERR